MVGSYVFGSMVLRGNEPSSACNRERIQLVDIQYAPKALSNDATSKAQYRALGKRAGRLLGRERHGGCELFSTEITVGNIANLLQRDSLDTGILHGVVVVAEAKQLVHAGGK